MLNKTGPRLLAGFRWALRDRIQAIVERTRCACPWTWEPSVFRAPCGVDGRASYIGRSGSARAAAAAFGGSEHEPLQSHPVCGVTVREVPRPATLWVPHVLRLLVDVSGPLDAVLARASHGVWRRARALAERACVVPVTEDAEIDRVSSALLEPYAAGRHHEAVNQVPRETVRDLAHRGGLVVVSVDGEEVAARLGYSYVRHGVAYFAAWRFGYPPTVFNNPERYGAFNGMNSFLAVRHAHDCGHQALDFGISPANPIENGQLQFKRMRGAAVSAAGCPGVFSLRIPTGCAARFLWARPVFSVEGRRVVLNLGVPSALPDTELADRIRRTLLFAGVSLLRLHAERPVSEALQESIRAAWPSSGAPGGDDHRLGIDVVVSGPSGPPC